MRTTKLLSLAAGALALFFLATSFAGEPRRVRVTLADGSIVEGTIEGSKDGLYKIKVGSTELSLAERDVKRVEFLEASGSKPSGTAAPSRSDEKPLPSPEEPVAAKASDPLPFNPFAEARAGDELVLACHIDSRLGVSGINPADLPQIRFPCRYTIEAGKDADGLTVVTRWADGEERHDVSRKRTPTIGEFVEILRSSNGTLVMKKVTVDRGGAFIFHGREYTATSIRLAESEGPGKAFELALMISGDLPSPCVARLDFVGSGVASDVKKKDEFNLDVNAHLDLRGFRRAGGEVTGQSWEALERELTTTEREANEASAIGALKTIASSEAIFREGDKDQNGILDYSDLKALGKTNLIDAVLATGKKQGYVFACAPSGDAEKRGSRWWATAVPEKPGVTGDRYFFINQDGAVHSSKEPFEVDERSCEVPKGLAPVGAEPPKAEKPEGEKKEPIKPRRVS
jgi:hypothetical protein